jgi:stage V sporulation protein B
VAAAKIYFILVGLVQQVVLKAVLGLQGFGDLSTVLSAASITYNPVVSTSIQGVSRAVAASPEGEQEQALRRTLLLHLVLAVLAAASFFLLAEPVGDWMGAPHVVPALRILSAILFLYGIYTPLVGALNGKKRFVMQAGLDVFAATLRTIGLIGGAWWFSRSAVKAADAAVGAAGAAGADGAQGLAGVEGASYGFVAGAVIVLLVALLSVGTGKAGKGGTTVREHLMFIFPLLGGQVLLNLLFQADAILLRRFASEAALAAGLEVEAAGDLVGAYRAAQLFCFLPFQLLLAITFILFPMLASAHRDGDQEAVAQYVRGGVRLSLVLAGMMVSVTSGLPAQLIALVFGADAAALGGQSMQLLSLGLGAFALFGIFTSVLNSLKHEQASLAVTLLAFVLVVVLCFWRVPSAEFGAEVLWRTAQATSLGLLAATLSAAWLVKRYAGALVAPLTLLRVGIAMAIAIAVGRFLPDSGKLMTIAYAALLVGIYAAVLLVSRELGRADLADLKAVVGRK